jgi:hypothetical protein
MIENALRSLARSGRIADGLTWFRSHDRNEPDLQVQKAELLYLAGQLSGAVIFGLLNDVPVDEAMRLGVTAASLTLQSTRTVLPKLSQELLYSKLMA